MAEEVKKVKTTKKTEPIEPPEVVVVEQKPVYSKDYPLSAPNSSLAIRK